jgi:hypothetical protein
MSERIISDRVANGNYVEHIKTVKTFSGRYYSSVDTFGTYVGNFIPVDAFRSYFPVDQAPIFTLNPKTAQSHGSKAELSYDCQTTDKSKTGKTRRHRVRHLKSTYVVDQDRPTNRNAKLPKGNDAKSWV